MLRAAAIPGVPAILAVIVVYVIAFNLLYTYIAAYLEHVGMGDDIDTALLVFGLASILGIWIVGAHIDRLLRLLTIATTALVALAAAGLAGAKAADTVQAVVVTLWNAATAAGGAIGGLLLVWGGPIPLAWSVVLLGVPVVLIAAIARRAPFRIVSRTAPETNPVRVLRSRDPTHGDQGVA